MASSLETKACLGCSRAKRKCGKQVPRCLRCRKRGVSCEYPLSKPTSFVLCREDEPSITPPCSTIITTLEPSTSSPKDPFDYLLNYSFIPSPLFQDLDGILHHQAASSWFASINTWEVHYPRYVDRSSFTLAEEKRYIELLRSWFAQWIDKGSNPFIHAKLYHKRFPRSIEDAYMALSCYLHKTETNEQVVLRLIEMRAKRLLDDHDSSPANPCSNNGRPCLNRLDALDHLARVQALLVYQFIGLYDGDIRLRHLAEGSIPVLNRWMQEMVQHASQAQCLGRALTSSASEEQVNLSYGTSDVMLGENILWYSWILAESTRRTWDIISGIQGLYLKLQLGAAIPCTGGMMFTTRRGAWDAPSASAWEKLCLEVNVGLIQTAHADKLFAESTPDDVDDFAKMVLECTFGVERMERWKTFVVTD